VRILIVDDFEPFRVRLRRFLTEDPDCDVVGEAGDGSAALDLIARLQPDVVLLDLQMPGMDGWELVKRLPRAAGPAVVLVTQHASTGVLRAAAASRVCAVLDKADVASALPPVLASLRTGREDPPLP
jgi:DNA-binding NarL/FixJ family response regulator